MRAGRPRSMAGPEKTRAPPFGDDRRQRQSFGMVSFVRDFDFAASLGLDVRLFEAFLCAHDLGG